MNAVFESQYTGPEIEDLLRDVDETRMAETLAAQRPAHPMSAIVARLHIAALAGLHDQMGEAGIDEVLRTVDQPQAQVGRHLGVFRTWEAYLEGLTEMDQPVSIEDRLGYAAAGFLARRDSEVRAFLRRAPIDAPDGNGAWPDQVLRDLGSALLHLIRQGDRSDVQQAGIIVDRLAEIQPDRDEQWLSARGDAGRRDAIALLGLYHLAQAMVRLSEYLLAGSVGDDSGRRRDYQAELRRLLIQAQDYLESAGDIELLFQFQVLARVMWRLYSDSIWKTARGLNPRMDELLDTLSGAGREHPIFSLLPSQQEALRESLLDPVRIAVVLQMPTSAGKTLLAEFAILQSLQAYGADSRVVYLPPTRALATQIRRALNADLRPLNISVSAAGSAFEEDPFELNLLENSDGVVVSTPEKLDLLLRAHRDWFDTVRLVVVDEAHLLRDGERGVRLELLLANLRRECADVRLLLLTPFVDNAAQIATWIGGDRGAPISIAWRPSRLIVGLSTVVGRKPRKAFKIEWREPHNRSHPDPRPSRLPIPPETGQLTSTRAKLVTLSRSFQRIGPVLGFFSTSKTEPEKAAIAIADERDPMAPEKTTPALRLAIALAQADYGDDSPLARCLGRGVAFHHAALSSELRFLIEDQVRAGTLNFIAATSTLAQGMNFPVSTVLVHSVHKPYGGGDLSSGEFWNIAGRAGRIGLADKGLVVFVNGEHREQWQHYAETLSEGIQSALLDVLGQIGTETPLKEAYRIYPQLRPFFQYLVHAVATLGPNGARDALDELLQMSLANVQATQAIQSRQLRTLAQTYLGQIAGKPTGYLKTADATGLGSFSFDELYARIGSDRLLGAGPGAVLRAGSDGIARLIDALQWLPELDLGIGMGPGAMDVDAVARVVQGWMDGAPVHTIANE